MARALVIKNADFSTNKVATVTFSDIKCTGVTLTPATLTVTERDAVEFEYSLTPVNTTDFCVWTSSDESVATIDNGIMTIWGIGQTTIRLRCGKASGECVVTCDLYEDPYLTCGYITSSTVGEAIATSNSGKRFMLCCAYGENAFENKMTYNKQTNNNYYEANGVVPIIIPNNTDKIHLTVEKGMYNDSGTNLVVFLDDEYKVISIIDLNPNRSRTTVDDDISIPTGATCYIMILRNVASESAFAADSTESAMKTALETNIPTEIHYLPAE